MFPSLELPGVGGVTELAPTRLQTFHSVDVSAGQEEECAERFASAPQVEKTYVRPVVSSPQAPEPWLSPRPIGVGAETVALNPNGQGQGVRAAVIEEGWPSTLPPDLTHLNPRFRCDGLNIQDANHCLAVLCIIAARGGLTGVAPDVAEITVVSPWRNANDTERKIGDAIAAAAARVGAGGVICIEAQASLPGANNIP